MLLCSVSGFVSKFVLANINYQPSFDIITRLTIFATRIPSLDEEEKRHETSSFS